jgi:hypothetical protein
LLFRSKPAPSVRNVHSVHVKDRVGRTVFLHPQEALLQQARAFQNSPEFQPYRIMRQTTEHCLARLVQCGIRQARYFGRKKTLIATKTGQMLTKSVRFFRFSPNWS